MDVAPKKTTIFKVFNEIAPRYDLLNRLLSGRQDVAWRKRVAKLITARTPIKVLDLATGTADVLLSIAKYGPKAERLVGLDPSEGMMDIGKQKSEKLGVPIEFVVASATTIPFKENYFDVLTMSFGIRNVDDYEKGLREMARVLKPGGQCLILEFSLPKPPLKWLYLLYFRHVLPILGRLISGHKTAYKYLNQTVEDFPYGTEFEAKLKAAGFSSVKTTPLTFGIASIYQAVK